MTYLRDQSYSEPTVFENYVQDLYVDDQLVELSLWDTAGISVATFVSNLLHLTDYIGRSGGIR